MLCIGHPKGIRKLTFRAGALALRLIARIRELLVAWLKYRKMELRYWLVHGNVKNNRIERKAFVDTVRIKNADLKNNFLF